jgi:hypothetical protein
MLTWALAGSLVAAWLAIGAGAIKVVTPDGAVAALRARRLPSHPIVVRCGGIAECALGILSLAVASILPRILLLGVYLGLTAYVLTSMRSASDAPCGCFGASSTRATWRHVALDAMLSVALAGSLAASHVSLAMLPGAPTLRASALVVGAVCAWLAASALSPVRRG